MQKHSIQHLLEKLKKIEKKDNLILNFDWLAEKIDLSNIEVLFLKKIAMPIRENQRKKIEFATKIEKMKYNLLIDILKVMINKNKQIDFSKTDISTPNKLLDSYAKGLWSFSKNKSLNLKKLKKENQFIEEKQTDTTLITNYLINEIEQIKEKFIEDYFKINNLKDEQRLTYIINRDWQGNLEVLSDEGIETGHKISLLFKLFKAVVKDSMYIQTKFEYFWVNMKMIKFWRDNEGNFNLKLKMPNNLKDKTGEFWANGKRSLLRQEEIDFLKEEYDWNNIKTCNIEDIFNNYITPSQGNIFKFTGEEPINADARY